MLLNLLNFGLKVGLSPSKNLCLLAQGFENRWMSIEK